ncbi:MAG TPA: MAPEG family protein [Nevskiaceae bacterium]|nr:MAPEG family protein [Nevskiaceae bacterium]
MTLTITPLYAGILAIWFIVLSMRVVAKRRAGINLGDGGDPDMLRRIRAHGNFAEYVPLILVMMVMLEIGGVIAPWVLHAIGIALVVARVLHGIALAYTQKWLFGRFVGTLTTFILLAVCGVLCLWRGLAGLTL